MAPATRPRPYSQVLTRCSGAVCTKDDTNARLRKTRKHLCHYSVTSEQRGIQQFKFISYSFLPHQLLQ